MLTHKQQEAVNKLLTENNIKVFGSAGTGKTMTLIAMYSKLLESSSIDRIPAIAFNKAVADEVALRTGKILNISKESLRKNWTATFHGFARRLLIRKAGLNIKVLTPYDLTQQFSEFLIDYTSYTHHYLFQMIYFTINNYTLLEERQEKLTNEILYEYGEGDISYHSSQDKINWNLKDYRQFLEKTNFCLTYQLFREFRFRLDPIPISFYELLLLVDKTFNKIDFFDSVFIDEAQDLSPLQWKIVKKIKGRIMLYGDDDQSIYGYRGANPKEFLEFPAYPVVLDTTFRFNTEYAQMLEHGLQRNIQYRQPKENITGKGNDIDIDYCSPFTIPFEKGVILSRTNKSIDKISEILKSQFIPHNIEKSDILDKTKNVFSEEIKKVFAFIDPENIENFAITITPFIRKKDLHYSQLQPENRLQILERYYPQYIQIYEYIKNVPIPEKIQRLSISPDKTLKKQAKLIINNIPHKYIEQWIKDIRNPQYTLATIHRIKGREWENVLINGFREGSMPLKRPNSNYEEEARITYVALSRTKNKIWLDNDDTPFINFLWR